MNPSQVQRFNGIRKQVCFKISPYITEILSALRESEAKEILEKDEVRQAFVDRNLHQQAEALLQFYEIKFLQMHTPFIDVLNHYGFETIVNQLNQLFALNGAANVPAKFDVNVALNGAANVPANFDVNEARIQQKVMRGELLPRHEQVIRQNYTYLLANIDATDLTDYLFQTHVITLNDRQEIERIGDKLERNRKFLDKILNAGKGMAFGEFVEALRKSYYSKVAKKIISDLEKLDNYDEQN